MKGWSALTQNDVDTSYYKVPEVCESTNIPIHRLVCCTLGFGISSLPLSQMPAAKRYKIHCYEAQSNNNFNCVSALKDMVTISYLAEVS